MKTSFKGLLLSLLLFSNFSVIFYAATHQGVCACCCMKEAKGEKANFLSFASSLNNVFNKLMLGVPNCDQICSEWGSKEGCGFDYYCYQYLECDELGEEIHGRPSCNEAEVRCCYWIFYPIFYDCDDWTQCEYISYKN